MADTSNKGMASADQSTREDVGRQGGDRTAETHGRDFYQEIGQKGGEATQQSENKHELNDEDRSKGGSQ